MLPNTFKISNGGGLTKITKDLNTFERKIRNAKGCVFRTGMRPENELK